MDSSSDENKKDSDEKKKSLNANRLKKFYEMHPEKKSEKIVCPECGISHLYTAKSIHKNSKMHKHIVSRNAEMQKLNAQKI